MPVAMIFIKPVFWELQLFSRKKRPARRTVRLIFQPAEEISEGASDVL